MPHQFLMTFRKFLIDRGGVAAMEFALLLPFMAALYFGAIEVSFLIQADRRVTNSTSVLADLTARLEEIDYCGAEDIFAATNQVLDPALTNAAAMRLSSVTENADGDIVIEWSQARNTEAYSSGDTLELAEGLMTSDRSLIIAEVSYDFDSPLGYFLADTRALDDVFYLRPRNSDAVEWQGDETTPADGCS